MNTNRIPNIVASGTFLYELDRPGTFLYELDRPGEDGETASNLWSGSLSPNNGFEEEHLEKAVALIMGAKPMLEYAIRRWRKLAGLTSTARLTGDERNELRELEKLIKSSLDTVGLPDWVVSGKV